MDKRLILNGDFEETGDYSPLYSDAGKMLGSVHTSVKNDLDQLQTKLHAGNALYVFNRVLKTDGGVIHEVASIISELQLNEKWTLILLDALTLYDTGVLKLDKESVEDIFHVYYGVIGSAYLRMMEISNNPSLYYEGNVKARFTNEFNKYLRSKEEGEEGETEFRLDDYNSVVEEDTHNNYKPEEDNKPEYDGSKDYVLKMRKDEQQRELEEQAFTMPEYGFNHVTDTVNVNLVPNKETGKPFNLIEPIEEELQLGGEDMEEEESINLVETTSLSLDEPTGHISKDIEMVDIMTAEEIGFLTSPDKLNFNESTEDNTFANALVGLTEEEDEEEEFKLNLEEEEEVPLEEEVEEELSLEEDDEDLFEDEEEEEPTEVEPVFEVPTNMQEFIVDEPTVEEPVVVEKQTIQEQILNSNPTNKLEIEGADSGELLFGNVITNPQPFPKSNTTPESVEEEKVEEKPDVEPTPEPVIEPTPEPVMEVMAEPVVTITAPTTQSYTEQVRQASQSSLTEQQVQENNQHAEALKMAMEQMAQMSQVIENLSKQVHDMQMEKIRPQETFVKEVREYPKQVIKEAHDNGTAKKVYGEIKAPVKKNIYHKNTVTLDEDIGYIYQPITAEEERQTLNDMSFRKIEEERRAIAKQVLISKGEV